MPIKTDHQIKLTMIRQLNVGGFHSGELLGKQLNLSRAAISKHIKTLQSWGLDIFSVKGRGYQLKKHIKLLDLNRLTQRLTTPVIVLPTVGSTNQYLLDTLSKTTDTTEIHGTICLAEHQSLGRGRRGRQWISPFASNIYCSMYWQMEQGIQAAMGVSLVVGFTLVKTLTELGYQGIKLKWPNDVYANDKKIAGILIEMSGQASGNAHLIIGVGINCAMDQSQVAATESKISQTWTSLSELERKTTTETDSLIDRTEIICAFTKSLQAALHDFERHGLKEIVQQWPAHDNFYDRPVSISSGSGNNLQQIHGINKGINEQGALLLATEDGIKTFISGDVSLRPI